MKSATYYSKPKRSAGILPAILDNGAVREKIRIRASLQRCHQRPQPERL